MGYVSEKANSNGSSRLERPEKLEELTENMPAIGATQPKDSSTMGQKSEEPERRNAARREKEIQKKISEKRRASKKNVSRIPRK
jgi:hypothetical protein